MTLPELITEYKDQVIICSEISYSDKQSVNKNNVAVKRMYEIIGIINSQFGPDGVIEFSKLLNVKDNNTYIWAAPQLLEKMNSTQEIKEKALRIIREVAKEDNARGIGFRHWLKQY